MSDAVEAGGFIVSGQTGIIGSLIAAISGLWGWHTFSMNKKDEQIKKNREEVIQVTNKLVEVIETNTRSQTEQSAALKEYVKTNTEIQRTLTEYVIEAAGGKSK